MMMATAALVLTPRVGLLLQPAFHIRRLAGWIDKGCSDLKIHEVTEAEATGRTAEIYADIRAVQEQPLVNLIWRELATDIATLEWAWTAARPLYASGAAATAANALCDSLELPRTQPIEPHLLSLVGVTPIDAETILATLDLYNHGNGLNLLALSALSATPLSVAHESVIDTDSLAAVRIPALPSLSELSVPAQECIGVLNGYGTEESAPNRVASLYRHLAIWPGFLALCQATLAPLQSEGALWLATQTVRDRAREQAGGIAAARGPTPHGDAAAHACELIDHFVDRMISRMLPIGLILRRAMPLLSNAR